MPALFTRMSGPGSQHCELFMRPVEELKEWHDFYVLVGTAGATLLALLFVAVSIGAGFLSEGRQLATRTFKTPVVVHFASVFFVPAVALFPWHHIRPKSSQR